jgi:hypothetical protein
MNRDGSCGNPNTEGLKLTGLRKGIPESFLSVLRMHWDNEPQEGWASVAASWTAVALHRFRNAAPIQSARGLAQSKT